MFVLDADAVTLDCATRLFRLFDTPAAIEALRPANLWHNKVLHERVVLLTVVTERQPSVPVAERMATEDLGKGFTEMTLRFGFAEAPSVPDAFEAQRDRFAVDLAQTSFFVGRENPVPTTRPDLSLWREKLYVVLTRNAVSAAAYFQIPPKRVVELGTQVEL